MAGFNDALNEYTVGGDNIARRAELRGPLLLNPGESRNVLNGVILINVGAGYVLNISQSNARTNKPSLRTRIRVLSR